MFTAKLLKEEILETFALFGLDSSKITAVVTDNAANVKKAVEYMDFPWISCGEHTL